MRNNKSSLPGLMWLYLPSQVIIDKPLLHRVKVEESMWSIETGNGCCIYINLEKTKEIMWKSVLEGEQGIDLTKVDTTRNISEFDEEAQAAIQRVTYDHHMKMLGKPTSQEKVRRNHVYCYCRTQLVSCHAHMHSQ